VASRIKEFHLALEPRARNAILLKLTLNTSLKSSHEISFHQVAEIADRNVPSIHAYRDGDMCIGSG